MLCSTVVFLLAAAFNYKFIDSMRRPRAKHGKHHFFLTAALLMRHISQRQALFCNAFVIQILFCTLIADLK